MTEHDHGDIFKLPAAQQFQYFKAILVGQPEVKQDGVKLLRCRQMQTVGGGRGLNDGLIFPQIISSENFSGAWQTGLRWPTAS